MGCFWGGAGADTQCTLWRTEYVDKIHLLIEFLNSSDENLKFKVEIGDKSLCFLDLKITTDDKKLLTSVYSKPTDSDLCLDGTSCHPQKV